MACEHTIHTRFVPHCAGVDTRLSSLRLSQARCGLTPIPRTEEENIRFYDRPLLQHRIAIQHQRLKRNTETICALRPVPPVESEQAFVSMSLSMEESDPVARLQKLKATTAELKTNAAAGLQYVMQTYAMPYIPLWICREMLYVALAKHTVVSSRGARRAACVPCKWCVCV